MSFVAAEELLEQRAAFTLPLTCRHPARWMLAPEETAACIWQATGAELSENDPGRGILEDQVQSQPTPLNESCDHQCNDCDPDYSSRPSGSEHGNHY